MGTIYDLLTGTPVQPDLPDDVQKYMEQNDFKLQNYGGEWLVIGEEDGEPVELSLELFISIYRKHYANQNGDGKTDDTVKSNQTEDEPYPDIDIERTEDFYAAVKAISECIIKLPLNQQERDTLSGLIKLQIQAAERCAFDHGLREGIEFSLNQMRLMYDEQNGSDFIN